MSVRPADIGAAPASGSAEPRQGERRLLLLGLGALGAGTAVGALVGASRLGLVVPPASSGSPGDAAAILVNNLEVCAVLVAATLLQPRGVASIAPGLLPLWLTDLVVGLVVTVNLVAVGGVLGALGIPALVRMLPHAPFELGGYLVVLVAYLRARRGTLERGEALRVFALGAALLACGALVESYVSGALL
jgi:hypothetical protein